MKALSETTGALSRSVPTFRGKRGEMSHVPLHSGKPSSHPRNPFQLLTERGASPHVSHGTWGRNVRGAISPARAAGRPPRPSREEWRTPVLGWGVVRRALVAHTPSLDVRDNYCPLGKGWAQQGKRCFTTPNPPTVSLGYAGVLRSGRDVWRKSLTPIVINITQTW